MTLAKVSRVAGEYGLRVLGAFHVTAGKTLVLLGPDEPRFWAGFSNSFEYLGKKEDPLDAYSVRAVEGVAEIFGAEAVFPFGGPPYHPFIAWAKLGGQVWSSPVGLLVHSDAGLFVSFRGALIVEGVWELPPLVRSPCDNCAEKPCLSACPAAALSSAGYDVPACHLYLDEAAGAVCLDTGCAVRRACPVGQEKRQIAQSAFHMRAFHKG